MLDDHARKAAQDHLDAAQEVDPTARAVDVAHPNGDALDGSRILPELFAESSANVCALFLIETDSIDSDICGGRRRRRTTRRTLHRSGNVIREWFSRSSVSCTYTFA